MTSSELQAKFNNEDWPLPCALIELQGSRGIAFLIGEALSDIWRPGNIIVFWRNGEHTILPDEFDLVQYDIWAEEFGE